MANPDAITVTDCVANGSVNRPAAQAIDTDGTVPLAAAGAHERIVLEVVNADDAALTVKIKAGAEGAGAGRAGLGDLSVTLDATGGAGDEKILGPFESARFQQADGKINVEFDAATGAPNATVRAYRLPKSA
ncbi:MAG TPA: hypothetical protein VGB98_10900 [Pyrinomonadaceae bacterium]|jgi:hypothetical protein